MQKKFSIRNIQRDGLAGFLQEAILKKVKMEDEVAHAFDPRPELPKYEKPKKLPLTAGICNFVKYNVIQLLP